MTSTSTSDVINQIAGIAPGSAAARVREARPEAVRAAQGSYRTLFEPDDLAGVSHREREFVGFRVATLTPDAALAAWHRERLHDLGVTDAVIGAVEQFPKGDAALPSREVAILRHTDLLTRQPGAATPAHIASLREAGLTPRDIVTVSQLIAYLSYEVRVLAGVRLLAEEA